MADEGLTTATNVTDPPASEGFGVELNDTVVAFRTVCAKADEVELRSLESPL